MEEEKYEAAIECFEKDIAEKKNLGEAYRGMGIAQYELEDYEAAIDSFEICKEERCWRKVFSYSFWAMEAS